MCCPFAVALDLSAAGGSIFLALQEGKLHQIEWSTLQWPVGISSLAMTAFSLNQYSKRASLLPPTAFRIKTCARGTAILTYALLGYQWKTTGTLRSAPACTQNNEDSMHSNPQVRQDCLKT